MCSVRASSDETRVPVARSPPSLRCRVPVPRLLSQHEMWGSYSQVTL